jgi:hypothetical protein
MYTSRTSAFCIYLGVTSVRVVKNMENVYNAFVRKHEGKKTTYETDINGKIILKWSLMRYGVSMRIGSI